MQCNRNMKLKRENSEGGFVLIVALMGIMILLAVGFFALTVSTRDLMIASRLVGERKAFSAAESGVHAISSIFAEGMVFPTNVQVDSANDPHASYSVSGASTAVSGLPETCSGAFSIEGGITWSCKNFRAVVTGTYAPSIFNTSEARIGIGVKGKASPNTPGYDFN
jgi:Tfp pilus assembly protein PilX